MAELDRHLLWDRLRAALDEVTQEQRTPPAEARVGSVLVLLEETAEGPSVVLTRRRRDLRSHPGQISFPGGRLDADETIEQAALREATEEIGLDPDSVELLGIAQMFYVPPSRFWVVPVLARWAVPHTLAENPWEVDEVLRVPVSQLLTRERWRHAQMSSGGSSWAWQLDDDLLWGATAKIMAMVLDVITPGWHGGLLPEQLGPQFGVRPWESVPAWQRRARLVGELPAVAQSDVPHVTTRQLRQMRSWLTTRGVGPLSRSEQAGRALAHAVRRLRSEDLSDVTVTVVAGPSSNGAGGLVAARLLAAAGAGVDVLTVGAPRFPEQTHVLRAAGVRVTAIGPDGLTDGNAPGEVVIDAVLGIGLEPPLRDLPELAAGWLRRHDVPVIALDLPSGVVADVGLRGPCVTADVTVALGLPTLAVRERVVQAYIGDLYLADLGVPRAAWRAAGVDLPAGPSAFGRGPLVRLTSDTTTTSSTVG